MSHKKAHKAHKVYLKREPLINHFVLLCLIVARN